MEFRSIFAEGMTMLQHTLLALRIVATALLAGLMLGGCSKVSPTMASNSNETVATLPLPLKHYNPGRAFDGGPVDLCLILSGQMYGYLQPCGCSRPQVGGLERRFELMRR